MKGLVLHAEWRPREGYALSDFEKRTGKAVTGNSVWHHPQLGVEEVPKPVPAPGQVLIEVKACGVCGSDMHFYETDAEGYILYPGLTKFPTILGHEFSGQIVAVDEGVTGLAVGDPVTAEEMIWCGECTPCRNGFPNQCRNLEEIGFTIPGAFAQYIAIGARYCWKLDALSERYDEGTVWELGAMVEPSSVAYNGIFERAGGFRPGGYAAVFGAGPIGLASIALCRAAGAAKVFAFEVSEQRCNLALKVGADAALDPSKVDAAEAILDATNGNGADMLVEAAGAPTKTLPAMERAMAVNARIVQIGRAAEKVPLYLEHFQTHAAQVFGAQGHSGNGTFENVVRLMGAGLLDLRPIVTARFKLEEVVTAIAQSSERRDGKIMVRM